MYKTSSPASGGGGSGTVTSVSVTTANGVSGSVATATTTPAISLTLGAITPSSVASTGALTGTNLSGTNTGDQTFTGDGTLISNSGSTGNITVTLANAAANTVWGNNTSGSAAPGYQTSISISSTIASAAHTITSASASALVVGPNGATNPTLKVDSSTASAATGITVKGLAAGSGVQLITLSSGTNESVLLLGKGTGTAAVQSSSGGNFWGANTAGIGGAMGGVNVIGSPATTAGSQLVITPAVSSTASSVRFSYTGASDTALTASTEAPGVYFNMAQTRQHSTGALTLQRDFRLSGSTHSAVGASTLTDVAAFAIDGYGQAGTNSTITNAHGLLIQTQAVAGTVTNAYGINISAPTGAATVNAAALFSGNVIINSGKISTYNSVATAGWGVAAIYGYGRVTAVTNATSAAITTYTVGAADGSFIVSGNVLVTATTAASMTMTVTYTDEGNTSRTLTLSFSQITGTILTAITNVTGTGAYEGIPLHIRCKAATSITFATAGTVTGITYNAEGIISQIS